MKVKNIIINSIRNIIILAVIALAIYIVPYIIYLPYFISSTLIFVASGILMPIIIYLIIDLVGNLLMSTNINTIKTLGVVTVQLISPAVLIYLVLAAFASTLSPFNRFISVSAILMSTYLAILGLLIRAFGSRFNYVVGDLIRGIGTTVLLFGMAMLFLPIYAFTYSLYTQSIIPAALPILALAIYNAFLYTAVTAIVITAIIFLGFIAPLRPVSMDMAYMSGMLMYVIAMISMVIVLGTLTPYSGYITALSVIALVITIALISYRLLTAYLRLGESKVRDVYHEYAIRVMERITVSDYELINAINNFMMNGNKDALLEYSMKALTRCKNVGTKILDEIKKYEPPYYGGLWPWGSSDIRNRAIKDAELRSKISTEIITLISTCQGGKQEIQVGVQPTTSPAVSAFQYTAEDGTRVYAQSSEELPVRPIEEGTRVRQEGTVVRSGESTVVRTNEEKEDAENTETTNQQ